MEANHARCPTAADQLTAAGIDPTQAQTIVAVVRSSEESAVTRTELEEAMGQLETRLYRALPVHNSHHWRVGRCLTQAPLKQFLPRQGQTWTTMRNRLKRRREKL